MGNTGTSTNGGGCGCKSNNAIQRGGYEYSRRATKARRHRLKSRILASRRPLPPRRRRRRTRRSRRLRRRRRRRKTAGRRRR